MMQSPCQILPLLATDLSYGSRDDGLKMNSYAADRGHCVNGFASQRKKKRLILTIFEAQ